MKRKNVDEDKVIGKYKLGKQLELFSVELKTCDKKTCEECKDFRECMINANKVIIDFFMNNKKQEEYNGQL